jgi:hypothetical protein
MSGVFGAIAGQVRGKVREFGERLAQSREIGGMSRTELDALARDVRIPADDIVTAVRLGPEVGSEAAAMMAQFGIDPAHPGAGMFSTRDAARTCLHCDERGRCHAELAAGTARQHAAEFCPNADVFESLASPQPAAPKQDYGCGGRGCKG